MGVLTMDLEVGLSSGAIVLIAHRAAGATASDYRAAVDLVQSQRIAQGDYDGIESAAATSQNAFDAAAASATTWQIDDVLGSAWFGGLSSSQAATLRDLVRQSGAYGYTFRSHQSDDGTNDSTTTSKSDGDSLRASAKVQTFATWSSSAASILGAWWSGLSSTEQETVYDLVKAW